MPIRSKTFKPTEEHGALVSAISSANTWLEENPVRLINIETLVGIYTGHIEVKSKEIGIRVWYETAST